MGKSLKGKELGTGITQRKDGLYQGRFTNRFGKKIFVYGKTVSEIRQKLRSEQYNDEKELNVTNFAVLGGTEKMHSGLRKSRQKSGRGGQGTNCKGYYRPQEKFGFYCNCYRKPMAGSKPRSH